MSNKVESVIQFKSRLESNVEEALIKELIEISKRILQLDSSIWGAETEAANRLGWVHLPKTSRELLPALDALAAWSRSTGKSNFVLCGMGGSSLGPEVIAKTNLKKLSILDSTDPTQIRSMVPQTKSELEQTLFIISSKSGTTIETLSQFQYLKQLVETNNLQISNHFVVVTDPQSPLSKEAQKLDLKVVHANPEVGGRFSVLSAFGLVPSALIGIDVAALLDDAEDALHSFTNSDSAAAKLAANLYNQTDFCFSISDDGSDLPGFSDWLEQLVAESTGKNQTGRLPVVLEKFGETKFGISIATTSKDSDSTRTDLTITAPLGAAFYLWEFATALLGYLLKVDPFNQPNVAEAKQQTDLVLRSEIESPAIQFSGKNFQIRSKTKLESLKDLTKIDFSYIAVMAYVDRKYDHDLFKLQNKLIKLTNKAVTVGYGPRFLHSTGQFHKGGPAQGAFIQLTYADNAANPDLKIPGQNFGFAKLISAQANGDRIAIEKRNRPLFVVEFKNFKAAIDELITD